MSNNIKKLVLAISLTISSLSQAGVYSDDFSRCLVESSTPSDKSNLVKWMFTSMALHPDVASMSSVTSQQRDSANKNAAEMITKLMTETCVTEAKKAIQYEGLLAIQQGFDVFGQVAGLELFTNPNVAQALYGLEKYMDNEKLTALGMQ